MSEKDPLAGGVEVTSQSVSFGKVGDFIKGTYTGKKFVDSKDTYLHEVKGIAGEFHTLDENKAPIAEATKVIAGEYYQVWGGKSAIDDLFKKSQLGDVIAIQFKESNPSKTKGNNPFKVFKTLQFGRDETYMGESSEATSSLLDGAEIVDTHVEGVDV